MGETVGFYCDIASGWKTGEEQIKRYRYDLKDSTPTGESEGWVTAYTSLLEDEKSTVERRVVEVGVFYRPPISTPHIGRTADLSERYGAPIRIATLGELLLTNLDTEFENQPSAISNVIPSETTTGKLRLSWNIYPTHGSDAVKVKRDCGMWSKLTKDFAWFVVWKGGQFVGVSHCLEFVTDNAAEEMEGEWRVDGVTWEGTVFSGP